MAAYAVYGEDASVIREGTALLTQFPNYAGRVQVALSLADAYQRTHAVDKELALYQDLLKELAARADGVPLGTTSPAYSKPVPGETAPTAAPASAPEPEGDTEATDHSNPAPQPAGVRSAQYNDVLNRALARLVALDRLPDALKLLRGELDRNPQDPGLYEKLADFLEQNRLNAHQEEVFESAIQQFQDTGWYAKLARFYVRQRRSVEYTALMHKVAGIFSGTDLEQFLADAPAPDASLALEVDLYAHQRFPHDLRFVERLLARYNASSRYDSDAVKLLWEHWWESPALRDQLFQRLSRAGQLESTVDALRRLSPEIDAGSWAVLVARNPAASRLWLEAQLWQSHYEQGADAAAALSAAYPSDQALSTQASSLYRSLAYFHPEDTDRAIEVERRRLSYAPGDLDTLARIGDIYADHERFAEAAPYWVRMGDVHPGDPNGYLQSATVFWDYFDFASAQAQLEKARARLDQPALFSYQEGSIAESRGDMDSAIRSYVSGATIDSASAESRSRLLVLARRPAVQAPVERATSSLLAQQVPTAAAIELRAAVLDAEHRRSDLSAELSRLIAQTDSFDVLDAVAAVSRRHTLPDIEAVALRRQIALTADPVRSLQLRYQLVDLLQAHGGPAAAQEIDSIYREHNRILGVVRSTVDYDWNHDRRAQAVSVLEEAAQVAYPELRSSFRLEAARKLTDLDDYPRARTILASLLLEKPLDADYEAAMAESFARAGDSAGLESFYRAQLDRVRTSSLSRDEKIQRTGQLRRSMISTATQLSHFDDAVDQYIELINAWPEDAALTEEAALYAVAHNNQNRIVAFYRKTINNSPRDPRWSVVLARIASAAEDGPLAADCYARALKLRPERQDLHIALAALDEHLHRPDDAIALYRRLYTLSYRDPQWMEKVAELSARQGRGADAVKALETAWIDGRPARAANAFTVAARLEQWGLLDEAQRFAEQGADQAGADLLVSEQTGAATYARILVRRRQAALALAHLVASRQAAPALTLSAVAQQVARQGAGAITDDEWRKQRAEQRRDQAASGFAEAIKQIGSTVARYYTPEERIAFAALLREQAANASASELTSIYIPATRAASLAALTSELEWNAATRTRGSEHLNISAWLELERRRGRLDEAAAQLEKLTPTLSRTVQQSLPQKIIESYHASGNAVGELRAYEQLRTLSTLDGDARERYFQLLLDARPGDLVTLAAHSDAAADFLVRHAPAERALAGVTARATGRPAVWRDAYTALTGLYLRERTPEVRSGFIRALDADATIGDRVAHSPDRSAHLAGDVWYYYGSRFAEYLDLDSDPRADDFLDSELELAPASAAAHLRLADYAVATHRTANALEAYQHTLDIHRDQPAVLNRIAELDWDHGDHAAAVAAWSNAVHLLAAEMDARRVPETFWSDFELVLSSISAHGQFETVRTDVDTMLHTYVARNGDYRVEPLVRAGYRANGNSIAWVIAACSSAQDQKRVLYSLLPNDWSSEEKWLSPSDVIRIYERILELAEQGAPPVPGVYDYERNSAIDSYVVALLKEHRYAEARAALARTPAEARNTAGWFQLAIPIADGDGSLNALLDGWRKQSPAALSDEILRALAPRLSPAGSRAVLRFLYERALERREWTAPNFLGLASLDLNEGRTPDAVQLLHRFILHSANLYADLDAAASLLESKKHPAEAIQFLKPLAESSPWNAEYRVRLARAELAVDPNQAAAWSSLATAAANPRAPYDVRLAAAQALHGRGAPDTGSAELAALAAPGCPSPEVVSHPLFIAARMMAATCSSSPAVREHLLRDALAIAPYSVPVRLSYITAAFATHEDARGQVAAEPYFANAVYSPSDYVDADASTADASIAGSDTDTPRRESLDQLMPSQAAALIRSVVESAQRRGDVAEAASLLRSGLLALHNDADRKPLLELRTHLEQERIRADENKARAPDIHAELTQGHIVQPRLLPGMPLPARPASNEEDTE
jgi:predicted Zn-dependent protease